MAASTAIQGQRSSFFDEQTRRRRTARRLGLICLAFSAAIGAVISAVFGPALLVLLATILRLLAAAGIAPRAMEAARHALAAWVREGLQALSRTVDLASAANRVADALAALPPLARASQLLLPAMAGAVLLWTGLARFHRRSAAAGATACLGAREPRPGDFEEMQLVNTVAEIALAAGLPAPHVLLVDSPHLNAAIAGPSHAQTTVLVTRGLLDGLDRAETQAVMAHLVASAGNGDLQLAAALQAWFGTLGALLSVYDLPFRRGAWTALRDLARALLGWMPGAQSDTVNAGLMASVAPGSSEAMLRVMSLAERWPPLGALLILPLAPWMLLTMFQKFVVQLWMLFVFGWSLGLLWRTRRYLADAVAVQLMRDPETLASALRRIDGENALPPGGDALELAFIHTPAGAMKGLRERASVVTSFTPAIADRLARLGAMGAHTSMASSLTRKLAGLRALSWQRQLLVACLMAPLLPLFGMLAVLLAWLLALATVVSVAGGAMIASAVLRP